MQVGLLCKVLNVAQMNYTDSEQELLAVLFDFEKLYSYLLGIKVIVHTVLAALQYMTTNKDDKRQHSMRITFERI